MSTEQAGGAVQVRAVTAGGVLGLVPGAGPRTRVRLASRGREAASGETGPDGAFLIALPPEFCDGLVRPVTVESEGAGPETIHLVLDPRLAGLPPTMLEPPRPPGRLGPGAPDVPITVGTLGAAGLTGSAGCSGGRQVTAFGPSGEAARALTDASGRFVLPLDPGLCDGRVHALRIEAPGAETTVVSVVLDPAFAGRPSPALEPRDPRGRVPPPGAYLGPLPGGQRGGRMRGAVDWYSQPSEEEEQDEEPAALPDAIGTGPAAVPLHPGEARILIVDATYPTPDRDSGSLDAVNFVRIFRQLGHRVFFAAAAQFTERSLDDVSRRARDALAGLGATVLDERQAGSLPDLLRRYGRLFRLAFLSRVHGGGHAYEDVRRYAPATRIVFNTVDLHSLRELREGYLTGDRAAINEAYRTAEREYYLARLADATIVVSDEEARLVAERAPGARVFAVPLIRDIPGGRNGFGPRDGIGFVGGYRHAPNVDAATWFLDEIWPRIRAALPDVRFHLVGADMPASLADRTDPGLVPVGHVDDLSGLLEGLRLTVAPLRYGAGAKGKVVSSLSHGVPCIATAVAAEGMGLGQDSAVLVADAPEAFADAVVQAYADEALWTGLSERGLRLMRRRYSLEAGRAHVEAILASLGLAGGAPDGARP